MTIHTPTYPGGVLTLTAANGSTVAASGSVLAASLLLNGSGAAFQLSR